ncbi:hypothetical protein N9U65_03865 [Planctomycetaceae bacterium]|nr:hypothetical protein [Planctomycetaceae bacterium]
MRTFCGELLITPINYFSKSLFQSSVASSTGQQENSFNDAPNVRLLGRQASYLTRASGSNIATNSDSSQHSQHGEVVNSPTSYFRDQLISKGAHRLTVEPANDESGWYHGSCRVAVDAQGELQRLFHAHAATEYEIYERLLKQVQDWQQKTTAHIIAKSPSNLSF